MLAVHSHLVHLVSLERELPEMRHRSLGENGKTRYEKNDWRDGLRNANYTLLIYLVSLTFFRILVNLMISVQQVLGSYEGNLIPERVVTFFLQ